MKTETCISQSITSTLLILVTLTFTVIPASMATAATVTIPDLGLEAAIRDALGIASPTPITDSDLATLTVLDADSRGITDLTGLEYCVNLVRLDLEHNSISDLGLLSGLTSLEWLFLDLNSISDVGPLAGLINLERLGIDINNISNVGPLSGLVKLEILTLNNNSISDLGPLSGLTNLEVLELHDNLISNVGPLSGLTRLTGLGLSSNSISDLSPLSGLTSLAWLTLGGNGISDVGPLSGLTSLESLYLDHNNISDLGPLSGLTALEMLLIERNNISDLGPLSGLTDLEWLWLHGNNISDIQPLVDNPGLGAGDVLNLRENPLICKAILTDIPILQGRGVTVDFDPRDCPLLLNVNIDPDTLTLDSKGKWITCCITSPGGCDVGDIDVASIRLNDCLEVQQSQLIRFWGGILLVKFCQSEVLEMVGLGETELTVTGELNCGLQFEGSDTICVIEPPAWPRLFWGGK